MAKASGVVRVPEASRVRERAATGEPERRMQAPSHPAPRPSGQSLDTDRAEERDDTGRSLLEQVEGDDEEEEPDEHRQNATQGHAHPGGHGAFGFGHRVAPGVHTERRWSVFGQEWGPVPVVVSRGPRSRPGRVQKAPAGSRCS